MSRLKPVPARDSNRLKDTGFNKTSSDNEHPVFCLRYLQKEFSICNCSQEQKAAFVDAIFLRSQMTWRELKLAYYHGLGSEKIDRRALKVDVPAFITEDVDFLAFRCIGKAPMVGYRDNGIVFHVIWIDRNFELYDHE